MHFISPLLLVSSIALVAAAPGPIQVGVDDIILYGKGRYTIMKRSDFEAMEAAYKVPAPESPTNPDGVMFTSAGDEESAPVGTLDKRAGPPTIIIRKPDQRFLGDDFLMSSVVKGAPTDISVASGHTIANAISVGVSAQFTLVKDFLSVGASTDYTKTWTSTQTQTFSSSVPNGKYGAFVSNAWTNRKSGNVWSGAIGAAGTLSPYVADSYESKDFNGLSWVDGLISLCVGTTFPLKRCRGAGTL